MIEVYKNLSLEDLDGEIWKDIKDFQNYQISNFGRVKSFKKWHGTDKRILTQIKNKKSGYFQVILYIKNKRGKPKRIHTLVFETFNNYKLKKDECIHHIDKNKENNNSNNLEKKDKFKHLSDHSLGENNSNFGKKNSDKTREKISKKLRGISQSEETKNKISKKLRGRIFSENHKNNLKNNHFNCFGENNPASKFTEKKVIQIKMLFRLGFKNIEISKIYDVHKNTISSIRTGKTWSHIKLGEL